LFLREFDSDGDGAIGRSALGHSIRAMGLEPSEKELAAMFAAIDTDGSGLIDFMVSSAFSIDSKAS
jgi:Ca2+-binding EF-hand superfamily protein